MLSPDCGGWFLYFILISGFPSSDILQGNFKPDFYLKYIQKDLRLAIALGDAVNHPTPMAAAANEVMTVALSRVPAASPAFLPLPAPTWAFLCFLSNLAR